MLLNISPLTKNKQYRLLYFGQLISFFGNMLTSVAIPYQIYELTKSSFMVGLLSSVQLVPLLLSALWGGALADVIDRRRLIIASEVVLALSSGLLAWNASLESPSQALIFVVAGLMSAVTGFHRPALEALTPQLVKKEDLPHVAALNFLRFNLGAIGGPALAGVLMATYGVGVTYLLDVATFAASVAAIAAMTSIPTAKTGEGVSLKAVKEGLQFALSKPELVGTYLVDIVAMLFAMPMALFPAMAQGFGGAHAAGWLYASMSIGSVAVSLTSGWTGRVRRHGAAVILAAAAWGVAIVALAFAKDLWLAVFFLALAGAADGVSGIYRSTIWNEVIPTSLRGRLASIEMLSYMTGPLLGNLRAGAMASASSNFVSIFWGGVLCVVSTLLCIVFLPRFWRYRSEVTHSRVI